MNKLLTVFSVFLFLAALYLVAAEPNEVKADPPFKLVKKIMNETIGVEVKLEMNTALSIAGVKDIYIGAHFPPCQRIFQVYVDFRDWNGKSFAKRYSKDIAIEVPRVCLSDFGVSLPLTQLCFKVKDLAVMPRGVIGSLVADISIGATVVQYKDQDFELLRFTMGQVAPCFQYSTHESCIKAQQNCGWCRETNQCFEARPDKKTDTCKFCGRCAFTMNYEPKDQVNECLNKESCGWCGKDGQCHPGDSLGPFDHSVVCDVDNSTLVALAYASAEKTVSNFAKSEVASAALGQHIQTKLLQQQTNSGWQFNQDVNNKQGDAAGRIALGTILGIFSGTLLGLFAASLAFCIPCCIYMQRQKLSATDILAVLSPQSKQATGKSSSTPYKKHVGK